MALFISIGITSLFSGCTNDFWHFQCKWTSNDPYIEFEYGGGSGTMVIDGISYKFLAGQSNDFTWVELYVKNSNESEHKTLFEATTNLRDGKLYLTVTVDNISDYVGKTIVFEQVPLE